MSQSQQAAEEAVEGGLVLPLLLELLSQLKEALPPSVQHPQSQPESALPPIRAPPAEDKRSSLHQSAEAPQVERSSHTVKCFQTAAAHMNQNRNVTGGGGSSAASSQSRLCTVSQGQVVRSSLREHWRLTQKRFIPLPPPRLHQERRTEEVGEYLLFE